MIQGRRLADPEAEGAPLNTRSAAFLAVNPMGLIPAIKDDDLVVSESLAINLYLARKYGGPLAGRTVQEEGLLAMWTMWAATEVEPYTVKVVRVYDDADDNTEAGKAAIEASVSALKLPLDVLEQRLAGHERAVQRPGSLRDPHPADEREADEVTNVPGPLMFEPLHQRLVSGRHVQFQDEQGDGDREDAIRECFETSGGQKVLVAIRVLSGCGCADGRTAQLPPY